LRKPTTKKISKAQTAWALGFRSGLEEKVADQLRENNVDFTYEKVKISYVKPESTHTYKPDFVLSNGLVIETKGRFLTADRQKHLLIKAQHPEMDLRFVFSNSNAKISKTSKTSYADWCNKHGFQYADKLIPTSWLK